MIRIRFYPLVVLLLWAYATLGWPVETGPVKDVDYHELAKGYAHLISFTAEPEVAAGRYTIDSDDPIARDSTLKTTKLPYYKEFTSEERQWRWYFQGAINYSSLEQTVNYQLDPPLDGTSDLKWTGYGGMLEAGMIFPLSNGFSWAAGWGVGVSHLENKADFSNPVLEDDFAPVDGRVFNWDTRASTLRANLGLLYDQKYGRYGLKGAAHFTYSQIDSFDESRLFSGFSEHGSTVTVKLDLRRTLDLELREHPVYVIGHIGSTNFLGSNRDEMGFDAFGELGFSVGVQKVTLGALAIFGDGVSGWNLILNYDY